MRLLGYFDSHLTTWHYQELLLLVEQAASLGEYNSAGFTSDDVQALIQQAKAFDQLPVASAGQRLTDDSLNHPLDLLQASYTALQKECTEFQTRSAGLLSILYKDSALVDQLLAAASLAGWQEQLPRTDDDSSAEWDYAMGYGSISSDITSIDPASNAAFPSRPALRSTIDATNGDLATGLIPPTSVRSIPVKYMHWSYTSLGEAEELLGEDWAKLTLLEDAPRVSFTQNPVIEVLLPQGYSPIQAQQYFSVRGTVEGGSLPIYVRTIFHPRQRKLSSTPDYHLASDPYSSSNPFPVQAGDQLYVDVGYTCLAGATGYIQPGLEMLDADSNPVLDPITSNPVQVHGPTRGPAIGTVGRASALITVPNNSNIRQARPIYTAISQTGTWTMLDDAITFPPMSLGVREVDPDSVLVTTDAGYAMEANKDFVVSNGAITFTTLAQLGEPVNVQFTEYWPAFQCSVNNQDWSPIVMFDSTSPYPDELTNFRPIYRETVDGTWWLALTDELGVPTGLWLTMNQQPDTEYLFLVTTPADIIPAGVEAQLEIELQRPAYLTGISLAPFSNFPVRLRMLETEGLSAATRLPTHTGMLDVLLDREVILRFPRQLVRKAYLSLYQENYSLKEHKLEPPDKLRRDTLMQLQSILPLSVRRTTQAKPVVKRGAQYEIAFENLQGEDWNLTVPAVHIAGPYRLTAPDIVRFDADVVGSPAFYLCFKAYAAGGVLRDVQLQGTLIAKNTTLVFPFGGGVDKTRIAYVDCYLKIVFTTADDIVERLSLRSMHV